MPKPIPHFDVAGIDSAHKLTIMVSYGLRYTREFQRRFTQRVLPGLTPLDIAYSEGIRILRSSC